jgi:hypothetical protein
MIEAADRNFFTIRQREDRVESQQSPLRQATGYRNALLDAVKKFDVLTHSSGRYQGKPLFPIGMAAMSNFIQWLPQFTWLSTIVAPCAYRQNGVAQWIFRSRARSR